MHTDKLRLEVIIPILISVISVCFNIYQYFDNKKLNDKQKELEIQKQELELIKQQKQNFAKLQLNLLYASAPDLVLDVNTFNPDTFDKTLNSFVLAMQNVLPMGSKLMVLKDNNYKKMKSYFDDLSLDVISMNKVEDIADYLIKNEGADKVQAHQLAIQNSQMYSPAMRILLKEMKIIFLVITNIGGSDALEIQSIQDSLDNESFNDIRISNIKPGYSVLQILTLKEDNKDSPIDFPMIEDQYKLNYIDSFSGESNEVLFSTDAIPIVINPALSVAD